MVAPCLAAFLVGFQSAFSKEGVELQRLSHEDI